MTSLLYRKRFCRLKHAEQGNCFHLVYRVPGAARSPLRHIPRVEMAGIEPATATLAGRARSLAVTPTGRLPRGRFGLPLWCSCYGCVKNQACTQGSQGRQELNPHFSGFGDRLPIRWLIPKKMKPPRGDFPGAVAGVYLLALTQQPLHRSGQRRAARPGSSTRLVSASAMSSYIHGRSSSRRGQLYYLTAAGNTVAHRWSLRP
jgi:hypothetical protein